MSTLPIIAFMLSGDLISFAERGTAAYWEMKVSQTFSNETVFDISHGPVYRIALSKSS